MHLVLLSVHWPQLIKDKKCIKESSMQFVQPKCTPWGETPYDFEGSLKWIEKAGRVCYDSLHRMTDTSAPAFVLGKIKSAHLSIIEHSNLVLRTQNTLRNPNDIAAKFKGLLNSSYIRVHVIGDYVYIAGNYRAFFEHALRSNYVDPEGFDGMLQVPTGMLLHYFKNIVDITLNELSSIRDMVVVTDKDEVPDILKRVTFEFLTDRAVTHELVRHRRASFSQRSQRYVKEGNLQIIEPAWYSRLSEDAKVKFYEHMLSVEQLYSFLMDKDDSRCKAEEARVALPNATATILVMTASVSNWKWILHLRDTDAAYPPTRALLKEAKHFIVDKGWLQYT